MSGIGEDIERVAEVVAPQIGVPVLIAKIVGAALVVALVGFVVWKVFFAGHAAEVKHEEVAAHAQAVIGKAQGDAGAHAANIVAGNGQKETVINNTTRTNYVEITKAPGAGDPVTDAVDIAGRRAVCMRASAAGLSDCQRLREADPK